MLERLQKILSARGIASRRKAEEYIAAGLVKVNGKVMKVGDKADPDKDTIEVDGKVLQARQEMLYYVVYKPVGVVTENISREDGSQSVRDLLPKDLQGKVYPVGRLDKDSEGLLLLTNDGVLAYRLTHPKFEHEKEYAVTVAEEIKEGQLEKMRRGMTLSGEKTKPAILRKTGDRNFKIALTEGKNRQIRRMCQKVGLTVARLERIRIMTFQKRLRPGELRKLEKAEMEPLLKAIGTVL